jgi:hypothetical protein
MKSNQMELIETENDRQPWFMTELRLLHIEKHFEIEMKCCPWQSSMLINPFRLSSHITMASLVISRQIRPVTETARPNASQSNRLSLCIIVEQ